MNPLENLRNKIVDATAALRWRFRRGKPNDATKITRYLRTHPGASTFDVTAHLWSILPKEAMPAFCKHVQPELDRLERHGLIVHENGWHLSPHENPFSRLAQTQPDAVSLVDTFGSLALSYSWTNERRLAAVLCDFVADETRDIDMRRITYIHLLDIVGIPVEKWPDLVNLTIPEGFDWRMINSYRSRGA